jgi:hypothetical protein
MQLDRDVQVSGIFLFAFLNTPCFEILLLPLFGGGLCFTLFLFSLIGAHSFSMLLEHILFSMTPLSFCKITRKEIYLDFGIFIFGGWMACFA